MKIFNALSNSFKALGLVLVLLPNLVSGQTTNYVSWDFTPALSSGSYDATQANMDAVRTTVLSSPTFTGLTLSGATSANNSTTLHRSTGWPNNTASVTASAASYVQFTITLASGQTFPNTTLTLDLSVGTSSATTAPNRLQPIYGYGASPTYAVIGSAATLATAQTALSTITIPAPGNITTTKLSIRLAAFATGASTQTGNLRLYTIALKGSTPLTGTPTIALQSPFQVTAANVSQGASNQPISNFQADVTTSGASLTSVALNTSGSYITSDITGFKLYYNSTANTFGSAVQIGTTQASVASGGTVTFSGLTTSINSGSTGYFWITASVSATGTIGNTFNAAASPILTFASGSPTGSITAGGLQTIADCTPVNATGVSASAANASSVLTWTNPSCYDEIMIVGSPAANTGGTPTGNGSAYTGNLVYASGTTFGNGYVLYQGATSSQTVTGLTNGTPYFFKFFTRKGSIWSAGIEVSATPVLVTAATDYFRSNAATGDWATAATWESSVDNATWITSTLAPTASATAITIRNGHNITISTSVTVDDITVANGGTLTVLSTSGTLNLSNGAATNDLDIQTGGIMQVTGTAAYTATILIASGGIINVATGGKVTVGSGAGVGSSYNTFVTATNVVWNDGAIFEWNSTTTPGASGVTYFANVNASTVPILRISAAWGTPGGGSPTIINGKIEVNAAFTWNGAGIKTFRNGIIGTATMSQSTTGAWVISGATADLGGSVTLSLGSAGATINTGVTLTSTGSTTLTGTGTLALKSSQTINNLTLNGSGMAIDDGVTLTASGTLTLTSGKITLGTTGTGNVSAAAISGGSSSSYIVTNGAGTLTQSVTSAGKLFPIGQSASSYDPVTIKPASTLSFSAKVGLQTTTLGTNSANSAAVVNREWDITGTAGTTDLIFTSSATNKDGSSTRPSGAVGVVGHYNTGLAKWDADISAAYASNTWTVTGYTGGFSPFIVASPGAVLSAELLNITAQSKGAKNIVSWSTASEKNNAYFDVQHATNGLDFQSIGEVKGNGTTNVTNNYTFEHATPSVIRDYYRLRQVDADGTATLSKVVSVVATGKNGALKVYPTLASDKLNISLDSKETVDFNVYNLVGQSVQSGQLTGQKELSIGHLTNGTYLLKVGNATVKFTKN